MKTRALCLAVALSLPLWGLLALLPGAAGAQANLGPVDVPDVETQDDLGVGYSITVAVNTGSLGGLAAYHPTDPTGTSMCPFITRTVGGVSVNMAHCPGDDLDPEPNGPPAIYCMTSPCVLRIVSTEPVNFRAIHGPEAFGATSWTGTITAFSDEPPTTTTTTTSSTTTTAVPVGFDDSAIVGKLQDQYELDAGMAAITTAVFAFTVVMLVRGAVR